MRPVVLLDQNTFAILGGIALALLALIGVAMLILKPFVDRAERKAVEARKDWEEKKQAVADHLIHFREVIARALIDDAENYVANGATEFIETCMPMLEAKMNQCRQDYANVDDAILISAEFARPVFELYADLADIASEQKAEFVQSLVHHSGLLLRLNYLKGLEKEYANA